MTLIERIARALADANEERGADHNDLEPVDPDYRIWHAYVDDVKIMLREMQNPTDAMAAAGATSAYDLVLDVDAHGARTIFAAMVDAALIDGA